MPIPLADLVAGMRLIRGLPPYLRNPITFEQARATLRTRLERREMDFLALARQAIFGNAHSPYLRLFNLIGCEYGDLQRLVDHGGLEAALLSLSRRGVYLTVQEFKGRRPIVRGSTTFTVQPGQFRNPASARHVSMQTSGSRGASTVVGVDLNFIRDCAVNACLILTVRGGANWLKADWEVPGAGAVFRVLKYSGFGVPTARWFSQVDPAAPGLHPRYRWSDRVLRLGSWLAGVRLPGPEYVPPERPLPIVRWMMGVVQAGKTPHLVTFPSSAVRLCQAARAHGYDLHGVQFSIAGEPITSARLATIRRSGANALPRFGTIETGALGQGCLAPAEPDDVHVLHDCHAIIQWGTDGGPDGLPTGALFVTSLRKTTPCIMLNVSLGDQAVMIERKCGCALERLGWHTHLHTIRSFEKLTAGGMTFLDTDIIKVLEEVLPGRFGGAPTDYQLVEEEANGGQPRLRLLVHPDVGQINLEEVAETFLSAIGAGSGPERVMGLQWRDIHLLRVERRPPIATASGKILHLSQGCSTELDRFDQT